MSRIFVDRDLERWEAFATAGPHGLADPASVVFRCVSNRERPSRGLTTSGDKSEAESAMVEMDAAELRDLFERAAPLN
jgi:hypothetical protein